MAVTTSARYGITRWSDDDDEFTRLQLDESHELLDATAAKFFVGSGTPPTGSAVYVGAFFYDTTGSVLYFYTGSVTESGVFTAGSWVKINEMATSVTAMSAGSTSVVGTSLLAARQDHRHALPIGSTTPQSIGTTASIGSSGNVSDAGHVHILADGSVNTAAKLASGVVETAKIADDAVTADKLADSAGTDSARAVTTNHVRDSAITTAKINNGAVSEDKLGSSSIVKSKIKTAESGGPGVYYNATGSGGGAIYYGTSAPSISANEGDLYFQYVN